MVNRVSKKSNSSKIFSNIYIYLVLFFLYAPIFILILYSFNDSKYSVGWKGFTFKWYEQLLAPENNNIRDSLFVTLTIAFLTTIIASIIGTISVIGIHNLRNKERKITFGINNIPILNPDIVTGVSLMILFLAINVTPGKFTMLLAHVMFATPYVILAILPKLKQLNPNVLEAALDLGATPLTAVVKVIIPQLMPGIVTGALIAFTLSIDDFVISYFTRGSSDNLSIWIYSMTKTGIKPTANAVSTIMLLFVVTLLTIIYFRIAKDFKKKETK